MNDNIYDMAIDYDEIDDDEIIDSLYEKILSIEDTMHFVIYREGLLSKMQPELTAVYPGKVGSLQIKVNNYSPTICCSSTILKNLYSIEIWDGDKIKLKSNKFQKIYEYFFEKIKDKIEKRPSQFIEKSKADTAKVKEFINNIFS